VKHLRDWFGPDTNPASITTKEIQSMLNDFLKGGYKRSSVQTTRTMLIAFFKYLKVEPNPAVKTEVPKPEEEQVVPWTDEEVARIRSAADELDSQVASGVFSYRTMAEFMLNSGLRVQEGAASNWEDIDRNGRSLRVTAQLSRRDNRRVPTKGKAHRTVPLLPDWWPFDDPSRTGPILVAPSGGPFSYRRLYDFVRLLLERAGLKEPGECGHQFRHNYAARFLHTGASIDWLSAALGHKKVSTTVAFYNHLTSAHRAKMAVNHIYGDRVKHRRGPRKA
jgi:integrase